MKKDLYYTEMLDMRFHWKYIWKGRKYQCQVVDMLDEFNIIKLHQTP